MTRKLKSIWDGIDRNAFYKILKERGSHRHNTDFLIPPPGKNDDLNAWYPFSCEIESNLAEYFAFLAAWKSDAGYVSAATVCSTMGQGGLIVSIAANDGVGGVVETAFRELFAILALCAQNVNTSRRAYVLRCLQPFLDLHHGRIRDRVSKKQGKKFNVVDRLTEMEAVLKSKCDQAGAQLLADQLETLIKAMRAAEKQPSNRKSLALVAKMIQAAYNVTEDRVCLASRLRTAGIDQDLLQRREIRVILALANYQRICIRLCDCARSYRGLFANLTLNVVQADWKEKRPAEFGGHRLRVHAEIQLLLYHENSRNLLKPRTIAASKRACFLCAAFISSHGIYVVQNSHGEIHFQWTVPDRQEYSQATRRRINQALRRTLDLVQGATLTVDPQAAQSVINLFTSPFRQPSVETIKPNLVANVKSVASSKHSLFSKTNSVQAAPNDEPPSPARATKGPESPARSSVTQTPQPEKSTVKRSPSASDEKQSSGTRLNVEKCTTPVLKDYPEVERTTTSITRSTNRSSLDESIRNSTRLKSRARHDSVQPEIDCTDKTGPPEYQKAIASVSYGVEKPWIDLYITMDDEDVDDREEQCISAGHYSRATCIISHPNVGDAAHHRVDFDNIGESVGMRLQRPEGAKVLDFVLHRAGHEDLMLKVEWSNRADE